MTLQKEHPASQRLKARQSTLSPHMVRVGERIWQAVNWDESNVAMIVGDDGLILVDAGMRPSVTEEIRASFRNISPLPIRAIIYTHGHGDHTGGSPSFVTDGEDVQVWARSNFGAEAALFEAAGLLPQFAARGGRQSGAGLPAERRSGTGLSSLSSQMSSGITFNGKIGSVPPTHFLGEESRELTLCGVRMELRAAPSETADALCVWLPDDGALFVGDALYRSFPNVYPVRGMPCRDVPTWIATLDMLRGYNAEALLVGHTDPWLGRDAVRQALTNYHDALEHVFRETVAGMNRGLGPDELVRTVKLPEHLASLDELGEYYGNVAWTVRALYAAYWGWFDGNPRLLLTEFGPSEEAARMLELAGGEEELFRRAESALQNGDTGWALRLVDHLLALQPEHSGYCRFKADALDAMSDEMLTTTGRNYARTVAMELRKGGE